MDKKTKITLDMLMKRKEQATAAKRKPKTKDLYIESLDGVITIKEPDRGILSDSSAAEDEMLVDRYLIYQCVVSPNLHDPDLIAAYGCKGEPDAIVDEIIAIGEQKNIALECLSLAGFNNKVEVVKAEVKDLKNA